MAALITVGKSSQMRAAYKKKYKQLSLNYTATKQLKSWDVVAQMQAYMPSTIFYTPTYPKLGTSSNSFSSSTA